MKKTLGFLVLFLAAVAGAWLLLQAGFARIQELRQLERVPAVQAAYMLPGEVTITAQAVPLLNTTGSYYTQTPSLYYLYVRERKITDSEGKVRWQREFSHQDGVDFLLQDESGQVLVRAGTGRAAIDWSLRESFSVTEGDTRHREWRLEPDDKVFVFGKAVIEDGVVQIRFTEPGFYTPLISHFSQADAQAGFAGKGLWWLWAGLVCLAVAVFALTNGLRIHRILVFVLLLGMVLILTLAQLSVVMMRQDLQNGIARYHAQKTAAENLAQRIFTDAGLTWTDWSALEPAVDLPSAGRVRLQAYQFYLALTRQRLVQQMSAVPERWLLPLWDLPEPAPVAVDAEQQWQILQSLMRLPTTELKGGWPWLTVAVGLVLAAFMTWLALRLIRVKRLIENLQLTTIRGVSCGIAETQGNIVPADADTLLRTPYFQTDCVWYSYLKEERRGAGKNARWVTLQHDVIGQLFYLRDAEGELPVVADQAEIITRHKMQKTDGRLRYTEQVLKPGDALYVVATAAIDAQQPDRLLLRKTADSETCLLSNYPEREVMLKKATRSMLALCAAFAGLLLALLMGLGLQGNFSALDFLAAAAFMPFYMVLLMLVLHYNDIIFLRTRALRNWANIEVALKKRKDLIDGFAKTAKAFLDHEKNLQQKLSQLRAALTQTQNNRDKVAEYVRLEQSFQRMLAVVIEKYPDLKGQQLMQNLMTVLTRGETEIALLRQGYNDAVTAYNTRIASVPDMLFARLFHFQRLALIAA